MLTYLFVTYINDIILGVKVAAGEGMPIYRNPFEKGNLVITFEVEYPAAEWFSIAENRDALAKLLPPKQDQGKIPYSSDHKMSLNFFFSASR